MGSPLMIGCDVRKANDATKNILLNKDIIAINQDYEARGAYKIKAAPDWYNDDECFILVKLLANGDIAIGFFNFSEDDREISLLFWDIGLPTASGKKLSIYDCWKHKELGVFSERFSPVVKSHDCVVVRAKLV